jgi:hypothetical protein
MCEIPENAKCENLKSGIYCTHWSDQILSDLVGSLQMLLIKQKYILETNCNKSNSVHKIAKGFSYSILAVLSLITIKTYYIAFC